MIIEPSAGGVVLKDAVAACVSLATKQTTAIAARVRQSFLSLSCGNDRSKERDMHGAEVMMLGSSKTIFLCMTQAAGA
jgi:hypothetical protein